MKKQVYHYKNFLTEDIYDEEILDILTGNVEIFKTGKCNDDELTILKGLYRTHMWDEANNLDAFDLKTSDFIFADELVNILNTSSGCDDSWYVGDPTEEYIYSD